MSAAVLALVPPLPSQPVIDALSLMLDAAQSGQLVGLAIVGVLAGGSYFIDITGEAARRPTFTRGALCDLLDMVGDTVAAQQIDRAPTL